MVGARSRWYFPQTTLHKSNLTNRGGQRLGGGATTSRPCCSKKLLSRRLPEQPRERHQTTGDRSVTLGVLPGHDCSELRTASTSLVHLAPHPRHAADPGVVSTPLRPCERLAEGGQARNSRGSGSRPPEAAENHRGPSILRRYHRAWL